MKKILIITQIVDREDPALGFFHQWIKEFSLRFEKVTVICLKKGTADLPPNVEVLSLGKEKGASRIKYLFNFYRYIFSRRKEYGSVFIHMNQVYAILGFLPWKILGKKVSLWYAHGAVPLSLRIAEKCADVIFASTPEGFQIKSPKLRIVGQGIDVEKFSEGHAHVPYRILTAGRISPVKRLEMIIESLSDVKERFPLAEFHIIGDVGTKSQEEYKKTLVALAESLRLEKAVVFLGPKRHEDLPEYLQSAHVFVNMSDTGSIDKAILEALSAGVPAISSNKAYKSIIPVPDFHADTVEELSQRIIALFESGERRSFRDMVVKDHSLGSLIRKIADHL